VNVLATGDERAIEMAGYDQAEGVVVVVVVMMMKMIVLKTMRLVC
jgi:hypothetical protein